MTVFGPGELTIGAVASSVDASCLVNSLRIVASVDAADDVTKLCGTVKPGARTYTWEMTGNLDIDDDAGVAGLFDLSQTAYGTEQPFTFTPNTEGGTIATGVLIINPMDFGADEYGAVLDSDVTWSLVGPPTYTYAAGGAAVAADEAPATSRKRAKADA
jgi:hypothetical protein